MAPLLVKAVRLEPVERTPVWFMRQAGRSLPGYREVRKKHDLFEVCRSPELCAQVTLEPVEAHGVDAAVMLQESRLSCSCHEATVTLPPGLIDVGLLLLPGAQATSDTRAEAPSTDSLSLHRGRRCRVMALISGSILRAVSGKGQRKMDISKIA